MSIYGLDVLVDRQGKCHLSEINGICSGMSGFKKIYGDSRVLWTVEDMIHDRHGEITVNDGTFLKRKFRKDHPIVNFFLEWFNGHNWDKLYNEHYEPLLVPDHLGKSIDIYKGQDSTVINSVNQVLPHPLVNPFVAEEITGNKFLQCLLLKDTEVGKFLPETKLIGLGTDEIELDEMLEKYKRFVLKPLLESCGEGIKVINREHVKQYMRGYRIKDTSSETKMPLRELLDNLLLTMRLAICPWVIENRATTRDYAFEERIWIAQPFIDTLQFVDDEEVYTSVRAIVCNGKFVDAYMRTGSIPIVNYSRNAAAHEFEREGFPEFCEKVVSVFERECKKYSQDDFRHELYTEHFAA